MARAKLLRGSSQSRRSTYRRKGLWAWGVAVGLSLLLVAGALAAGVGRVAITTVDASGYPTVTLYLAVNDVDGQPITDLQPDEVTLYENDVQVSDFTLESTEHPMLIGVVIDSSGSFARREGGARRVDHAREAARRLISPDFQRLILDDEVAVFAFSGGLPVRLVDFTYDHNLAINEGLNKVDTAGNQNTALFDLVRQAIEDAAGREGVRRRILLVFSDGTDLVSGVDVDRVIQEAVDAHLVIYTVGLGNNLAPDQPRSAFLRRLADETGGRYMWYRPGRKGAQEALDAFLDLLVSQRQGYALRYSTKQYEGTPEVRVAVSREGRVAEDTARYEVPPLPPEVVVENLQEGQVLVGSVTVRVAIRRAQRPIDRVEYRVDGELVYTAKAEPWDFPWDTTAYGNSPTEAAPHQLTITVYDIGGYQAETGLVVGVRLPPPTPTPLPTPTPAPTPTPQPPPVGLYAISASSLLIALIALILLIVLIRRGGMRMVGQVAAEVRRRTRVLRGKTRIFGGQGKPLATLVVADGAFEGRRFEIYEPKVFLGREEERSDLVFDWDDYVSRRHAKIAKEGDRFYIWDLNSANGTWVDEQRVPRSLSEGLDLKEALPLQDGAVVRLGPYLRLVFHTSSPVDISKAPTQTLLQTPEQSPTAVWGQQEER